MAAGISRVMRLGKKTTGFACILALAVALAALTGCGGSSDTQSAVRNATSLTLNVNITSPSRGATLLFDAAGENENITFTYTTSGGVAPYGYTWTVYGPNGYQSTIGRFHRMKRHCRRQAEHSVRSERTGSP